MGKTLLKITGIILGNLFAFLTLGHILDSLFKTEAEWKIIMLVVSILPLGWLMFLQVQKHTGELHNISEK